MEIHEMGHVYSGKITNRIGAEDFPHSRNQLLLEMGVGRILEQDN